MTFLGRLCKGLKATLLSKISPTPKGDLLPGDLFTL
jgi:hypothetical protein